MCLLKKSNFKAEIFLTQNDDDYVRSVESAWELRVRWLR